MKPKITTIILSTLFSIILWVFVSFSLEYTTSFRVPVKLVEIKDGYSLLSQSIKDINITVKGQGWVLAQVASGPETVYQVSTNGELGVQRVDAINALSKNSWINSKLQVAMVSPSEINYTIERVANKIVPIISDESLGIKGGYGLVSKVSLTPDSVSIVGPQSLVKSIESISTEKFKIEDIDEKVSTQIVLKPLDYIDYSQNFTNIEFDVQKIVDKTFKSIPVQVENVPNLRELQLFPPNINVTLRGGLENLGVMSSDSIRAIVDFKDAFLDSLGAIKPKIKVPNYTTLTIVNPKTFKYIIKQN
jgi:YbbR-like protein